MAEPLSFRLDGKVALVTGGSKGIGKGIAAALANAGAQVVITSRKAENLEPAAAEIGMGCDWLVSSIGQHDTAAEAMDTTIERHGSLDILVNNAASNPYAGYTIDIDMPRWQKTVDNNITAPLVWIQLAWQKWMREHGGAVVNIASAGGFKTSGEIGAYNITKAAMIHMTRQLAAEIGPGVRVNCVAPGLIKTDFARILWEGERGVQRAQGYPMKRLGEPEDIGAAVVFCAAEASSWMTGETILMDGGGQWAFEEG